MKLSVIGSTSNVAEAFPVGPTSPNADRDTALDHDPAAVGPWRPPEPTEPSASDRQAEADVDAAIEAGRAEAEANGGNLAVGPTPPIVDPLTAIRSAGS